MDVSESESLSCDTIKKEEQGEPKENHSLSSPNKQDSIFSLSIDEFQDKDGKSFESMNMEELLNGASPSEASLNPNEIEPSNGENEPLNASFSIPTSMYSKTVEEVWASIAVNQSQQYNFGTLDNDGPILHSQTAGEMTLEDFLVKAGVIQESADFSYQQRVLEIFQNHCQNLVSNNAFLEPNAVPGQVMGYEFPGQTNFIPNNFVNNGALMYQTGIPSVGIVGEPTNIHIGGGKSICLSDKSEPSGRGRPRSSSMEVVVERKQRRMIKNRESAARSRARKQAYTAELEIELNRLKEENESLKHILVMEQIYTTKTERRAEKLKSIRRASSLSW
ncbi:unnamed protein product [Ilex paraguariensis]|uniref:BZIP domain-containing protein n=1 Tax=Ilex paraguariensis TaxID=185542 RepID=A0ABC8UM84_9AQUA